MILLEYGSEYSFLTFLPLTTACLTHLFKFFDQLFSDLSTCSWLSWNIAWAGAASPPFTTISLQFSITSTTAPFWRPQTAPRWCCRWQRFWRRWKIRQEAATSQRSTCPSLWYCAHGRGPSSVCCSCWAPCGWDTPSTLSSGGRYS